MGEGGMGRERDGEREGGGKGRRKTTRGIGLSLVQTYASHKHPSDTVVVCY